MGLFVFITALYGSILLTFSYSNLYIIIEENVLFGKFKNNYLMIMQKYLTIITQRYYFKIKISVSSVYSKERRRKL